MSTQAISPYVGLRPFSGDDAEFFFGRDREIRVISANLQAEPLTVLYGPSGVGKSSVLQAGVVLAVIEASNSVLYFRAWQDHRQLLELIERLNAFIITARNGAPAPIFLLLDQFEEYLLYRPGHGIGERFDSALARLINIDETPARVLIGIREDSLSRLDQRFSVRVSDLFRNTLEIARLTTADAREAIEKPLLVFNQRQTTSEQTYGIEPALIEEILSQVRYGEAGSSASAGMGGRNEGSAAGQIETAFLQLVLKRLWDVEISEASFTMRLDTLKRIGGAGQILERHVNDVMSTLADDTARAIAARMFRYLVTPSRTKIPQSTTDLVAYAEAPEADVRAVLKYLSDRHDSRILRRLTTPERYELYHDVLAQPVLDWRRTYFERVEQTARERELHVEAARKKREATTLRWLVAAMAAFLVTALAAAYIFRRGQQISENLTKQWQIATAQAKAAENRALAETSLERAATAALAGKTEEANQWKASADRYRVQADEFQRAGMNQETTLPSKPTPRDSSGLDRPSPSASGLNAIQQQLDDMTRKYSVANGELNSVRQQLNEQMSKIASATEKDSQLSPTERADQKPTGPATHVTYEVRLESVQVLHSGAAGGIWNMVFTVNSELLLNWPVVELRDGMTYPTEGVATIRVETGSVPELFFVATHLDGRSPFNTIGTPRVSYRSTTPFKVTLSLEGRQPIRLTQKKAIDGDFIFVVLVTKK